MVVFGQSCCIRAKVVVIRQKWLCSGKSGSIRAKVILLRQKMLLFCKVFVYSDKSGSDPAKK